jgi:hypothetical protein
MDFSIILLIIIFVIIPAIIIAYVARGMGYSTFLWLIYGLISWPLALINLLVLDNFEKVITRRMRSKPGRASANIPKIEKSIRYPHGPGTEGVEVYVFNGKEYPARDIAEHVQNIYIADLRARSEDI